MGIYEQSGGGGGAAEAVGTVKPHAAAAGPAGFIKCNGAAVSRTTYAALFAAIGTVYGVGDGSTTFNIPDLRGEFIRGADDGAGVDVGRVFGSWENYQTEDHRHNQGAGSIANGFGGSGRYADGPQGNYDTGIKTTIQTSGLHGTETRPRNVAMHYWIKF